MREGVLVGYIALTLLAGAALILLLALRRGLFRDTERPKYEMLGIPSRELPETPATPPGWTNEGAEDRIVRLALVALALYYALARLGVSSVGGIVLVGVGLYLAVTALAGTDPVYRLLRWDTRLPEHRGRR